MAQVIIRNLDDALVQALKARAKRNGRSLEQELREIVTDAARPSRPEILERIDRIRVQASKNKSPATRKSDSVDLLREDRDR